MNVRVIVGEDDFLVEETAKKAIGGVEGLEVIDSANATNAELQLADLRRADESFSTPPFLDPSKATWWKNVHFLPGGRSSEEVKEALEKFAAKIAASPLPENQVFVISGPTLLKTSVFAKRLAGVAEIVSFAAEKPWEAQRGAVVRAIDDAAAMGLKFAAGAAERFVATVGVDSRSLRSELEKMRDYLGPSAKEITAADVAEISSPGAKVEAEVWDVTDAIGARNPGAALAALSRFERESGYEVFMSGVIEKFFRQLLDVKLGRAGAMSPYAARKNAGFAAKWSENALRRARARFLALREKAVSGSSSVASLVSTELLRAFRAA